MSSWPLCQWRIALGAACCIWTLWPAPALLASPDDAAAPGAAPTADSLESSDSELRTTRDAEHDSVIQVISEDTDVDMSLLQQMSLDELLSVTVSTATKTDQTLRTVPAVVSVVTRADLDATGVTSLAEALSLVPGLYDIYDLVTHNFGVRGINGGIRASGSIVKLMIDGEAVPFRPNTGNFFGEELIPIDAVERIEVVRGPASALYGANAYLGVINVITRVPVGGAATVRVRGHGSLRDGKPSYGASVTLGAADADGIVSMLASVATSRVDRAGLTLPSGSPILQRSDPPPAAQQATLSDDSEPRTLFVKATVRTRAVDGKLTASASLQSLDSDGHFQDFGPLSALTRVALENRTYRLQYELEPIAELLSIKATATAFESYPSSHERLDIRRSGVILVRNVKASGYAASTEVGVNPWEMLRLTGGVDVSRESHLLQTFDTLSTAEFADNSGAVQYPQGTRFPSAAGRHHKQLQNVGLFGQALYQPEGVAYSGALGVRLDNHSVYGSHVSSRAALVYAPPDSDYHLKLLFGTSFKAPSAEQLYTDAMQFFDVKGNAELKPQNAQTGELAGGLRVSDFGNIVASAFVTRATDRVEFVQRGVYFVADNLVEEWIVGGELEARLRIPAIDRLSLTLNCGIAKTARHADRVKTAIIEDPGVDEPLYPVAQARVAASYLIPTLDWQATVDWRYASARDASRGNVLELGRPYQLPGYQLISMAVSTPVYKPLEGYAFSANVRVFNILDTQYAEPGFGGIDLPTLGRTVWLTLVQEL